MTIPFRPLLPLFLATAVYASAGTIQLDEPVNASIPDDLILYWNFDDLVDVEVPNRATSGESYDGFLFAGGFEAPDAVPSLKETFGKAIRLQGGEKLDPRKDANPFIQWLGGAKPTVLDLEETDFTAGLWVKFEQLLEGEQVVLLISRGRSRVENFWDLSLRKIQQAGIWVWVAEFATGTGPDSTAVLRASLPLSLQTENWHHLAMTYQYGDTPRVALYFDGVQIGEGALAHAVPAATEHDRRLTVGERAVPIFPSCFNGELDDIFIARGLHQFEPPAR